MRLGNCGILNGEYMTLDPRDTTMGDSPILLRDIQEKDLPIFFEQQLNQEAVHMAAFTAKDPADHQAFMAHWAKIMAAPEIVIRTIVWRREVVGHVMSYESDEKMEVTYWLGREFWGQGIATRALSEFLLNVNPTRPMYARAAKDNIASQRVLDKCGFKIAGEDRGYANARQAEIEEWLFALEK